MSAAPKPDERDGALFEMQRRLNDAHAARAELAELREDLDALGALAGRVATFTRDGHAVDHQTCVELVAFVTSARDSLGNAEACLVESADGAK